MLYVEFWKSLVKLKMSLIFKDENREINEMYITLYIYVENYLAP